MNDRSKELLELAIRPMELRDAEEVCALIGELGYERTRSDVEHWIDSLGKSPQMQAAFVATLSNEVAGWIEISIQHRLQSAPYALIGGLVVKDGLRDRQIGKRLCERAEQWSWESGVGMVRVTSRSTRLDAHRFYLNNGYRLTKTSQIFEKGRPEKRREISQPDYR